ncbi:Uu.00g019980.m01.CDS01 [Anthostomella pinea]|uniref:Uu.00g019980.m01.CDS01 n=1 Tax=Anthostomella pinea TaxID=933095 RepID=A0AAI8YQP0_9PEZI|nr:Uu.00g019980.m01.CDS01 [Anthostomella pinea]
MSAGLTFTKTIHKTPYPSISPTRPALSQAGRTVLITGGGAGGIGYAIAQAFLTASTSRVITLGRRADLIQASAAQLSAEFPSSFPPSSPPQPDIRGLPCDITDPSAVAALWRQLADEGVIVNVLVLNAAVIAPAKPVPEMGTCGLWGVYEMNVRAQLDMAARFYGQTSDESCAGGTKIHYAARNKTYSGYGLTKSAAAMALQVAADDTPVDRMQVVSFHPGAIFTQGAKKAGYGEQDFPWDNADLPGHFAVWAASPEARFLHGRFVWANWDVDELKSGEIRKRIDEDPNYLKIGVRGL